MMTTIAVFATLLLVPFVLSQTKFSDSQKTKDVDEKIFTGDPTIDTLGGGLIGVGLGALGASILGPTIGQVLGGGSTGFSPQTTGGCGRRKRQADGETRFFLPSGGSCSCGRRKRQASATEGTEQPNTKFFGNLFGGNDQNCGSCCYSQGYNQGASQGSFSNQGGYNQGGYNQGGYNQGSYNQGSYNQGSSNQGGRCQCDNSKTFTDQNGRTHGACRRADNSGRNWCYTTGWANSGCGDLQSSKRFPNNPWSYRACSYSG
jgi:hypothetical protein